MNRCARLGGAAVLLSCACVSAQEPTGTIVRFTTDLGAFDVELADGSSDPGRTTPLTVENFLAYVNSGAYDGSFIHRSVRQFVVQGGGFRESNNRSERIPTRPPVPNEPRFLNTRATVSMAKLPGDTNSATNQWFVNLRNNENLDRVPGDPSANEGGYTVFGLVIDGGMSVIDAIAGLPIARYEFDNPDNSSAFGTVPLDDGFVDGQADPASPRNLVVVESVRVLANVPEVSGLSEDAARNALVAAGFSVVTEGVVNSEGVACAAAAGVPALNARAPSNGEVTLQLVTSLSVPSLRGESAAEADASIAGLGLTTGAVDGVGSSGEERVVIAQSPAAGSTAPCDAAINYTLGDRKELGSVAIPVLIDILLDD